MGFDGTLKFDTSIDKSGFEAGLSKLGGIAKKGMSLVTGAVSAAAGKLTELGMSAISVGEGFESSMAQVIATMGVTKDTVQDGVNSYELLKKAAADAGEATTFSASEAADALNYLALAGYSAAQASDALPAVLNLAAAGGLDLAYASDLATDAMSALGIEATKENLTHFGDQMAVTASKANTSVGQLGEAILTVGGTAKSLAGGTTELNAALGVLANRGIKGSEGGTALRNMILSLSAPTDKAAKQLDALGVEVFDATGKMRPLNTVFKDLDKSLAKMNDSEKTQVLNNIFNKVDLKSAQAMLAGCGAEFDNLTKELNGCDGAMADMAQTMNDTLEGDMKSLGSKAEALGIAVYDSLNAPLRELAQLGGTYISQLTAAFKEGGFEKAASAFGDVLGQAVTKLNSYLPKVVQIGSNVIKSLAKSLKENLPVFLSAVRESVPYVISALTEVLPVVLELGGEVLMALADGVIENIDPIIDAAVLVIEKMADGLNSNLPKIAAAGITLILKLADALTENIDMIIQSAVMLITTLAKSLLSKENLSKLLHAAVELVMALAKALTNPDTLRSLVECAFDIVAALVDALAENADEVLLAAVELVTTLCSNLLSLENLEKMWDAGVQLLKKLWEGIKSIFGSLLDWFSGIGTEIGYRMVDVIEDAKQWGKDLIQNFIDGCKEVWNQWEGFWEGVGETIYDYLHHSTPEKGPLKDDDTWGSDFMENFITGAAGKKNELVRTMDGISGSISAAMQISAPAVESDAVRLLQNPVQDVPYVQPSATSTVVNNSYTYNNNTTEMPHSDAEKPVYNINAKFEIDGERFAEYAAEKVDMLQGEAVTLEERGTAH